MNRVLTGVVVAALVAAVGCVEPSVDDQTPAASSFPAGQLLLRADSETWLYSAAEGARSLGPVTPFDLSPDGAGVLAARSEQEPTGLIRNTELLAIDTRSEDERVIVQAGDRETLDLAKWSPDGSSVAYRLTTYAADPSEIRPKRSTVELCLRNISTFDGRCFEQPDQIFDVDWYPDNSGLLIAGRGDEPVFRLDLDSGTTEVVIPPGGDQALQSELDRLGYGRPMQFVVPQISPSGRYIAALVMLEGGTRLYVPAILGSTGELVSLAKPSGGFPDAFAWSPARDLLAYTVGEAPYAITELYLHDPAATSDRLLGTTEDEGPMIPRIDGVAWSPDGRWVAFSRPDGVRVVDTQGEGPDRELRASGTVVDWGP